MNLYFLKYNNYYNRTIKKFDTIAEYADYQVGDVLQGVSFNPNDDVMTTQVVNRKLKDIGNYIICVNDDNSINSRWFIIESKRERTGQYTLTLRRDLVADNYNQVLTAPCFIEKATLNPTDPMIFNSEDMSFNQIKTDERQLTDETGCAWVVGYIPRDAFRSDTTITSDIVYESAADITVNNITSWEYYRYSQGQSFKGYLQHVNYGGYIAFHRNGGGGIVKYPAIDGMCGFGYDWSGNVIAGFSDNTYDVPNITTPGYNTSNLRVSPNISNYLIDQPEIIRLIRSAGNYSNDYGPMGVWKNKISTFNSQVSAYTGTSSRESENEFRSLDGKIIYDTSTQTYYKIRVSSQPYSQQISITSGSLFNSMAAGISGISISISPSLGSSYRGSISGSAGGSSFRVWYSTNTYTISLEQLFTKLSVTLNNNRYHLEDQPYDMFCIPYSNDLPIYKNGQRVVVANKSVALGMSLAIAPQSGSGNIYDVQLLPYCPVRFMIKSDGTFDIGSAKVHYIKDLKNNTVGIVLWAATSQFTFDIPCQLTVEPDKIKQVSQTDLWRLCSPNFNGQFEFNVAMNGGVSYINVDCNYKPYSPYIHLNPNFGNLYGHDFNDARGLICGGDFSLPQITSAWADYQLNNKNYNEQFSRTIQNMKVNNSVQREKEIWGMASGVIGAGASGAAAGAMLGGPIGAVIGGIAGAGTSAIAGGRDLQLNEKLRQEALDYTKDQFGYQLGNIQAIPYNLTKTSALTLNNKVFPILEYYTCTDAEKAALNDKLHYNGMTVMRIGQIGEFIKDIPSYIKGKLIRFEGFNEDFHVLNELANEINKGVFI